MTDLLLTPFLGTPLWMWGLFLALVLGLLLLDLGLFHKEDRAMGIRESLWLSAFYITLGLGFAGFVAWQMGAEASELYLTAFLIEKTLALDNLFIIALIFGALSTIGGTLTLPGIAGIVLTIGMAVDANVLIYERIREELRNGNSPQAAIHAGFDRAFDTILDSNLTTLIAAIMLFGFGTGPIKGFAVTLSIGILTSMFTAVTGSRALVNLIYGGRKLQKLTV